MTQFALSVDARRAGVAALVLAGMAAGAVVHEATSGQTPLLLRVVEGHPTRLVEVGPAQRWIVACQARGTAMAPYVFRDGGDDDGAAIDALEAWSTDGRWLAVAHGGVMTAIDLATGAEQAMAADVQRGGRRAKFDQAAARLVYFRGDTSTTLVVRQLATGNEAVFNVGDVEYFEIHDGPWIAMRYRRAEDAWGHTSEPCAPGEATRGPSDADAWLDTTSGSIVEASPSTRP